MYRENPSLICNTIDTGVKILVQRFMQTNSRRNKFLACNDRNNMEYIKMDVKRNFN
jgi:hypothetical protein